jgi:hypothetical protein
MSNGGYNRRCSLIDANPKVNEKNTLPMLKSDAERPARNKRKCGDGSQSNMPKAKTLSMNGGSVVLVESFRTSTINTAIQRKLAAFPFQAPALVLVESSEWAANSTTAVRHASIISVNNTLAAMVTLPNKITTQQAASIYAFHMLVKVSSMRMQML